MRKLPFNNDYADVACSIHVIEHFYEWEVIDLLKEWNRVLKPGGKLILELPSMDRVFYYIAQNVSKGIPLSNVYCWLPLWGDPKHKDPHMCHRWGYTFLMLKEKLEKSGFIDVQPEEARYHFPERDMRVVSYKPSTT